MIKINKFYISFNKHIKKIKILLILLLIYYIPNINKNIIKINEVYNK